MTLFAEKINNLMFKSFLLVQGRVGGGATVLRPYDNVKTDLPSVCNVKLRVVFNILYVKLIEYLPEYQYEQYNSIILAI